MSDKKSLNNIYPSISTRNLADIEEKSGNVYLSINIMGRRSNQIQQDLKQELHSKLAEFASTTDNLEEVFENREQIEISKFYERLPHAVLISADEYMEDKIYYRFKEDEEPVKEEKKESK